MSVKAGMSGCINRVSLCINRVSATLKYFSPTFPPDWTNPAGMVRIRTEHWQRLSGILGVKKKFLNT